MKLIVVHRGFSRYLLECLNQAAKFLGPANVILMTGDIESHLMKGRWERVNIGDFFSEAQRFASFYEHLSTNSYEFELFCFQRWFVANEYCRDNVIEEDILLIDSDVLIYDSFRFLKETDKLIANCRLTGPQVTWFRNWKVLTQFTEFVTAHFLNEDKKKDLRDFFLSKNSILQFHGGNVCDMHLLGLFCLSNKAAYLDLEEQTKFGVVDNNISVSDGFELDISRKHKKIVVKNKQCYLVRDGELVRSLALHFQGGYKKLMSVYSVAPTDKTVRMVQLGIMRILKHMRSIVGRIIRKEA